MWGTASAVTRPLYAAGPRLRSEKLSRNRVRESLAVAAMSVRRAVVSAGAAVGGRFGLGFCATRGAAPSSRADASATIERDLRCMATGAGDGEILRPRAEEGHRAWQGIRAPRR